MMWIAKSLLAAGLALPVAAQANCPFERAEEVPLTFKVSPQSLACSGAVATAPLGVSVTNLTVCPLFVAVTPTHEKAVPSSRATETVEVGQEAEILVYYRCAPQWFLFFSLSPTCDPLTPIHTGAAKRLKTRGCQDVEEDPTLVARTNA